MDISNSKFGSGIPGGPLNLAQLNEGTSGRQSLNVSLLMPAFKTSVPLHVGNHSMRIHSRIDKLV